MPSDEFREVLRDQGLGDMYDGFLKSGLFFTRETWSAALRGDDRLAIEEFTFHRDEPVWDDAGWNRLTAGLDSSLRATGWAPLQPELSQDDYVRGWTRGRQRVVVGRADLLGDSTSFVTAVLTGPRGQ